MKTAKFVLALLLLFGLILSLPGIQGCTKKIYPPPARTPEPANREARPQTPALQPAHVEPTHPTQRQYTVLGQTYTPLSTYKGYVEEGIASWYGPKFHGRRTSSGEVYNMYEMTAAHRVLPMNTKVRVTNLDNGKVIDLRVNDRGPFVGDRIIDLSFAAAREIEMIGPGTARVRVEALGSVPRDQLVGNFFIQVGSFSSKENAFNLKHELRNSGYRETRVEEFSRDNQSLWRVQAGLFKNLLAAEQARSKLLEKMPGAFIIAD